MVTKRIDITERVAAQNVVNDPRLKGKPLHVQAGIARGTRLLVGPKTAAGTGDALRRNLDRAIRTGSFKFEQFAAPQAVPVTGAKILPGTQRLTAASVRGLEAKGIIQAPEAAARARTEAEKATIKRRKEAEKRALKVEPSVGKIKAREEARELKEVRKFFETGVGPVAPTVEEKPAPKKARAKPDTFITGFTKEETEELTKTPVATEFLFGERNPIVRGTEAFVSTQRGFEDFSKKAAQDLFTLISGVKEGEGFATAGVTGRAAGTLFGGVAGAGLAGLEATIGTASKFLGAGAEQITGPFKVETPFTLPESAGRLLEESSIIERKRFEPTKGKEVIFTQKSLGALVGLVPDVLLFEGSIVGKAVSKVPKAIEKFGRATGIKRITRLGEKLSKAEAVGEVEQVLEVTKETKKGIQGDIAASQLFDVQNIFGKSRVQAAAKGRIEAELTQPIARVPVVQKVFVEGAPRTTGRVTTLKTTFKGEVVAQKVPKPTPGKKLVELGPAGKPVKVVDIPAVEKRAKAFEEIAAVEKPKVFRSVSLQEAQEVARIGKKAGIIKGREVGILGAPERVEGLFGRQFTTGFQELSDDITVAVTRATGKTKQDAFLTGTKVETVSVIKKPIPKKPPKPGVIFKEAKVTADKPVTKALVGEAPKALAEPFKVPTIGPSVGVALKQQAVVKGLQESSKPIFRVAGGGEAVVQQAGFFEKTVPGSAAIQKPTQKVQQAFAPSKIESKQLFREVTGEKISPAQQTRLGAIQLEQIIAKPIVSPSERTRTKDLLRVEDVLGVSPKQKIVGVTRLGELTRFKESSRISEQLRSQEASSFDERSRLEELFKPAEKLSAAQKTRVAERTRQAEKTRLAEKGLFDPTVSIPTLPPGFRLPLINIKIPGFVDIEPRESQQGFNVKAKSRGKFRKLNKLGPLTESDAKSLGGSIVDGSASAQFRIHKAKGRPVKPEFVSSSFAFRSGKFRNPIRKGKTIPDKNIFIEKTSFRIDSPGELDQITAEGLLAIKRKKSKQTFAKNFLGI